MPQHNQSLQDSQSNTSRPYLPQGPDVLILPDGPVGEQAAELLDELVHPHHGHGAEDTLVEEQPPKEDDRDLRPWYRRPSPLWLLCTMPFSAIATASTIAPRVEIYTQLACQEHKPEYTVGRGPSPAEDLLWDSNIMPHAFVGFHEFPESGILSSFTPLDGPSPFNTQPFFLEPPGSNDTDSTDDGDPSRLCASDPEVQAAVARLMTTITSVTGVLSCLTTAWWGSLSDRHGRTAILGISVVGLLITDANFIFVTLFSKQLPGGYWFLIVGPIIEGCVGGLNTSIAAIHAYMADCASPGARSRIFSLSLGLMFTGIAIGPTFGGLLIRLTHLTLSVFYLATAVHFTYALLVWFVLPESLSVHTMAESRRRRSVDAAEALGAECAEMESGAGPGLRYLMRFKRVFGFLSPLAVFAPVSLENEGSPGKYRGRDWSLTLLVASYAFSVIIMGSYQFKLQYAAATFGWNSEELGYWLSLIGSTRAFYLTLILPVVIKLFNMRKTQAIQLPIEPSEPLHPTSASAPSTSRTLPSATSTSTPTPALPSSSAPTPAPEPQPRTPHTPSFDLGLARFSLALEVVCYTLIPLVTSPATFTIFTMLASFGAGFNPAVQSLALTLFARRGEMETGRLFGALSVVQTICQQILGPALFGLTYMNTVATFPKTIFFLSATSITISFVFISSVRLPAEASASRDLEGAVRRRVDRERTLVGAEESAGVSGDGADRGRKVATVPLSP